MNFHAHSRHRKALIESGIAARMLQDLKDHMALLDPPITCSLEECNFFVKVDYEEDQKGVHLVIEFPNPHPLNQKALPIVSTAFLVREMSFGRIDTPPLSRNQYELVMKLASGNE